MATGVGGFEKGSAGERQWLLQNFGLAPSGTIQWIGQGDAPLLDPGAQRWVRSHGTAVPTAPAPPVIPKAGPPANPLQRMPMPTQQTIPGYGGPGGGLGQNSFFGAPNQGLDWLLSALVAPGLLGFGGGGQSGIGGYFPQGVPILSGALNPSGLSSGFPSRTAQPPSYPQGYQAPYGTGASMGGSGRK